MQGVRAAWRMSAAGRIADVVFDAPDAPPRVRDRLASLGQRITTGAVVFPDVPIGSGATWRSAESRATGNGTWDHSATYRLRSLADTTAIVDETVASRAGSQALRVEPNRSTRLDHGTGSATAEIHVPLAGLLTTGSAQLVHEARYSIVSKRARITQTVHGEELVAVRRVE